MAERCWQKLNITWAKKAKTFVLLQVNLQKFTNEAPESIALEQHTKSNLTKWSWVDLKECDKWLQQEKMIFIQAEEDKKQRHNCEKAFSIPSKIDANCTHELLGLPLDFKKLYDGDVTETVPNWRYTKRSWQGTGFGWKWVSLGSWLSRRGETF